MDQRRHQAALQPPLPQTRKRRREQCRIHHHALWLVFLSLPLRSLIRCRSVCKAFNSVVTDRLFLADYRRHLRPREELGEQDCDGFFVTEREDRYRNYVRFIGWGNDSRIPSEKDLKYTFYASRSFLVRLKSPSPPFYQNKILASSGGILLCSGVDIHKPNTGRHDYYVVNPLTKEYRALPDSSVDRSHPVIGFVCREVVPSAAEAYDYIYEVVKISHDGGPVFCIKTYSSRSRQWSEVSIQSEALRYSRLYKEERIMIAVGGVFCWLWGRKLFMYDPDAVTIKDSPMPVANASRFCLGDGINGKLVLYAQDEHGFDVWIREDCRVQSWQMKIHIEWSQIAVLAQSCLPAGAGEVVMLPYCWAFQGVAGKVFVESTAAGVFSYDIFSEKLKMLHDGRVFFRLSDRTWHPYQMPSWHFHL